MCIGGQWKRMSKVIIYDENKMHRAAFLLSQISATGIDNFRMLAELGDIIDSGQRGEYSKWKEKSKNGMESKKICPD